MSIEVNSSGQIHGIINREDAWRMWKPYDERGVSELDGSLDIDAITPEEANCILWGSYELVQNRAFNYWHDERDEREEREWTDGLAEQIQAGTVHPDLKQLLQTSHDRQQAYVERRRQEALRGEPGFVSSLKDAIGQLAHYGILTSAEINKTNDWLHGPDGTPALRYVPMSYLEYGRFVLKYDHEWPDLGGTDGTDFRFGVLRSINEPARSQLGRRSHNRVHETVHGFMSGCEFQDITREDGWRHPEATVVGMLAYEPTTNVDASDDYSRVTGMEITEGWTDFTARVLMTIDPSLGTQQKVPGYSAWAMTAKDLWKKEPSVFRKLTETMLVEATVTNPSTKREAIEEMHEYADRRLGVTNALTTLFTEKGGSILDVHQKGARNLPTESSH